MGLNKLAGTPWHIESYHREENDKRRHNSRCKYYNNGKCSKLGYRCFGSAHCKDYKEVKDKVVVSPGKYFSRKMIPYGDFKVMYLEDSEIVYKVIGESSNEDTISIDASLTKEVLKNEIGSIFKINEELIKLIDKNIKYK